MATVTLSTKGQLTIPREMRDALKLAPGSKLQASIDRHGRLVLAPHLHEPASLFQGRPKVARMLTVEEMDQAIRDAVTREDA